ncbi:hypothetical protein E2542_SST17318 [Spatholobus suberectus]|nr:hypothetical protein E2542_SST17318 [Spatholobus suberectus]
MVSCYQWKKWCPTFVSYCQQTIHMTDCTCQYNIAFIYFLAIVIHGENERYGSVSRPVQLISVIDDLVEISPAAYSNPNWCFFRVQIEGSFELVLRCLHAI